MKNMINQIIKSVKEELNNKLVTLGLTESKSKDTIQLGKEIIQQKISAQLSGANVDGLMSLFTSTQPLDQSQLVQNMIAEYRIKLVGKFQLTEQTARQVATFFIPFIMSKLSNKIASDGPDSLRSIVKGNSVSLLFRSIRANFTKNPVF